MKRMMSTIEFKFGDIVIVNFPFSGNTGSKKRPAVVISTEKFNESQADLILLAITSNTKNLNYGEALIGKWNDANLLKPSAFKSVIFSVEKQFIYKKLGHLSNDDLDCLCNCIKKIITISVHSLKS